MYKKALSVVALACATILILVIIAFVFDYLDTSDFAKARAFETEPKVMLRATVADRGVLYEGTCSNTSIMWKKPLWGLEGQDFRSCSPVPEIQRLCEHKLLQYIPEPASPPASNATSQNAQGQYALGVGRLLRNPVRQLRGGAKKRGRHGGGSSCSNKYIPWLLVNFEIGGAKKTRCAYPFGTLRNSDVPFEGIGLLKPFNVTKSDSIESVDVWMQKSADYCVVGFDSLRKLTKEEEWKGQRLDLVGFFILLSILCGRNERKRSRELSSFSDDTGAREMS